MSLDIWFKNDLRNILFSINVASAAAARLSDETLVAAYRQGFEEALVTTAVALGISPEEIRHNTQQSAGPTVRPVMNQLTRGNGGGHGLS